ncbi:MAG: extracellular solute-binding protein [Anaerolineae bacterium]
MSKRLLYVLFALLLAFVLAGCAPAAEEPAGEEPAGEEPAAEKPDLSIIWFAWPPCEALGALSATYPDANVTVNCVPIGQWHDQTFTDFAAQGGNDLVIGDSQWTGEMVAGNHLIELTDFINTRTEVDKFVPAALASYGEYPPESGRYWSVPIMADVQVLIYNKPAFEAAGFEPPETWSELLEQAQAFKEGDIIEDGFTWFWCGATGCEDLLPNAVNQVIWSFGGEIWDPETYTVEGVLNSDQNVATIEFLQQLYLTGPEGSANYGYDQVLSGICNGTVAMTAIWVGFMGTLSDPNACAAANDLGYAMVPGETEHYLQLGGMGISVSAYTPNPEAALDFLAWLESYETQIEWVKLGGYSARTDVLASEEFLNAAPWNALFSESYALVKDFWNVPEYNQMQTIMGEYLNPAIAGEADVREALDAVAAAHQQILDEAYPDGPPR